MSTQLPAELAANLDELLEGVSRRELAGRSEQLTAAYRSTGTVRFRDRLDVCAYAVARMPATFAAISAALHWTLAKRPMWRPRSLLDLGSGPGTAIWAARGLLPSLKSAVAVERDEGMAALALELSEKGTRITRLRSDVTDSRVALPASDLVVAAYVAGEVSTEALPGLVARAWAAASGVLLLVEPGTPSGAGVIGRARALLVGAGADPLAPCPNALPCPMAAPDWCHVPVRLPRSRAHLQVKGAVVPFEDEKFSYLAVSRNGPPPTIHPGARIVGPPEASKAGVCLTLCREGRLDQLRIPRRQAQVFKTARKLRWGDEA